VTYPDKSVGKLGLLPLDDHSAGADWSGADIVRSAAWNFSVYAENTRS